MKRSVMLALAFSVGLGLAACNDKPNPDNFDSWKVDYDKMMKEQDQKLEDIKKQAVADVIASAKDVKGKSCVAGAVKVSVSIAAMRTIKERVDVKVVNRSSDLSQQPTLTNSNYMVAPDFDHSIETQPDELSYINMGCDLSSYANKIRGYKEVVVGSPEFVPHKLLTSVTVVKPVEASILFICKSGRNQPMSIHAHETIMNGAEFRLEGDDSFMMDYLEIVTDELTLIGNNKISTHGVSTDSKRGPSLKLGIDEILGDGHLTIEAHEDDCVANAPG